MNIDKYKKIIAPVIIFCMATSVLYMNPRSGAYEKARILTSSILPSPMKKTFDRVDDGELRQGYPEENQAHVKHGQNYEDVGKTERGNQFEKKVSLVSLPGKTKEITEKKNNQRRTDDHQPHLDPNIFQNISDDVIKMAPGVFEKIPRQFLPEYKSPCWFSKQNELYCLPYFYIIGMAKCGTTELWDKITQHPDVVASVPKEPHWWAWRRNGFTAVPIHGKEVHQIRKMTGKNDDSSVDWYLNWCKTFGVKAIESNPSQNSDGDITYPKVFGDASISTSFDMRRTWGSEEGNYTNADLIHAVQPHAKIIMIVRDPVERFFSDFNYDSAFRDKSLATFDKVVHDGTDCFTRCIQKHSDRFCIFTKQCSISTGFYIAFAEDWMRLYGHDGVYILRLEDWQQNTAEEFKKVLHFLDLPALSNEKILEITSRKAKNVNGRKAKVPTMWNTTRKLFQDFFRPYNRRLADFLNDKRFEYNG